MFEVYDVDLTSVIKATTPEGGYDEIQADHAGDPMTGVTNFPGLSGHTVVEWIEGPQTVTGEGLIQMTAGVVAMNDYLKSMFPRMNAIFFEPDKTIQVAGWEYAQTAEVDDRLLKRMALEEQAIERRIITVYNARTHELAGIANPEALLSACVRETEQCRQEVGGLIDAFDFNMLGTAPTRIFPRNNERMAFRILMGTGELAADVVSAILGSATPRTNNPAQLQPSI